MRTHPSHKIALPERRRRSANRQYIRIQQHGHQRPTGGLTRSNLPALAAPMKTLKSSGVKCRKPDSGWAELLITTVSLNVAISTHSPVWQRLDRCQSSVGVCMRRHVSGSSTHMQ
jgi:hypothetical protein